MKKIVSYEDYASTLADFKAKVGKCATNQLMTRQELTEIIGQGRFYSDVQGGTLWFLEDKGYFYAASLFAPEQAPITAGPMDKDVRVLLTGNQQRYDLDLERKLMSDGFDRFERYLEYSCQIEEILPDILAWDEKRRTAMAEKGYRCRRAVKADYPQMWEVWTLRLGLHRYNIEMMDDAAQEEMERRGRHLVVCDASGKICATAMYEKKNKTALGSHIAAYIQGIGLGSFVLNENILAAYREGCAKYVAWIRDDNDRSIRMHGHMVKPTGKFYWQFILRTTHA